MPHGARRKALLERVRDLEEYIVYTDDPAARHKLEAELLSILQALKPSL